MEPIYRAKARAASAISSFRIDFERIWNCFIANDLPLNFHPAAIRASAVFDTPNGGV
jgi:hypothetical protein